LRSRDGHAEFRCRCLVRPGADGSPVEVNQAGRAFEFLQDGRKVGRSFFCGPADFAADFLALLGGRAFDGERFDAEAGRFETGADLEGIEGGAGGDEGERGGLQCFQPALEPAQDSEGEIAEDGGDAAEDELAAAEAESDNGGEPEGGGGGDAEDHVVLFNDGACADEADAGEDAEGQTHEVHDGVGVGRFAVGGEEEVHLDHGDGGGHGDEESGAQAGGMTVAAAVRTEGGAGDDGEDEAQGDGRPMEFGGHADRTAMRWAEERLARRGTGYR
jgi:hypothetical protein